MSAREDERRAVDWRELERLLREADRHGLHRFSGEQLERLAVLYRGVTTDLATAKTRGYDRELLAYLNRLTARGHAYVHGGSVDTGWSRLTRFFTEIFPREVRASGGAILMSTSIFLVAAVIAYVLVILHPNNVYALLPAAEIPLVSKSLHDANFAFDRDLAPAMSAAIISNNIRVSALAFAGGMTLGALTLWELLNNGLMTGGLAAFFSSKGFGTDFWATIAPHGVIELTAIQIASGAGLLMASAIIAPGRLRRADALRERARRAGTLIIGVAAMLVVAGIIEGFISPQRTPIAFRCEFGAATALMLTAYFSLAGATSVHAP